MELTPGSRLGSYEVVAPLGSGGMGEVYRARDMRLHRDVAIKVLSGAFTADPERLARFEREAQLLAQLHHPNIASVFGFEESSGVRALVMELVSGEDLSERITRGPIPVDEALPIARQIAEALEAAHEDGIIHRDLKPANVKVLPDGGVKVLDFGLAKAMDPGGAFKTGDAAESPTVTARATQVGTILGTAAYMSPEQARGKPVDRRADIWAFGVVLYEMLSGRRAFAGEEPSDLLAAILRQEIDWTALPVDIPPGLRRLLGRCLDRDAKRRLRDIGEARIQLDELQRGRSERADHAVVVDGSATRRPVRRNVMIGAALTALILAFAAGRFSTSESGLARVGSTADPVSFERLTFQPGHFVNSRFAPDGQTVFLTAGWRGNREVFQVRPQAGELPVGLPNAELLSVSRSGELALLLPRVETGNPYVSYGTLAVVSASGGTPRELAENVSAADWTPDGGTLAALRIAGDRQHVEFPLGKTLYESPDRMFIIRVSPDGNAVAFFERMEGTFSIVVVDRSGERHVWSKDWSDWWSLDWSPDGREIWFSAARAGVASNLYAVDHNGTLRTLLSAPGTLVLHDVSADSTTLAAQVAMTTQVLGRARGDTLERDLSWLEASDAIDLSADGRKVLLQVNSERDPGRSAVFLRSMDGSPPVRLGYGTAHELSRDGNWALTTHGGTLVAMPTAAGKERTIQTTFDSIIAARWLPDTDHVLVLANDAQGRSVTTIMSFSGNPARPLSKPIELRFGSIFNRRLSPVSPDARFVAAAAPSGEVLLVPLDGGASQPLKGGSPGDLPIQWSSGGRGLLVFNPGALPAVISEIDLESGRRQVVHQLLPADRVGVYGVVQALMTLDRSAYVYGYQRYRSDLYRVKGLR